MNTLGLAQATARVAGQQKVLMCHCHFCFTRFTYYLQGRKTQMFKFAA